MFDMINIFEVFLPQLLRYPNPTDPLNGDAAALLMREPKGYDAKVKGRCSQSDRASLILRSSVSILIMLDPRRIRPEVRVEGGR